MIGRSSTPSLSQWGYVATLRFAPHSIQRCSISLLVLLMDDEKIRFKLLMEIPDPRPNAGPGQRQVDEPWAARGFAGCTVPVIECWRQSATTAG